MAMNPESIKQKAGRRGFALLIAVIFMSVMLTFGLALGSLSYKQQVLASEAIQSQYAFYVADAILECALYADQQQNLFSYANHDTPGLFVCGDAQQTIGVGPGPNCYNQSNCPNEWISSTRLSIDSNTRCVDLTVYKPVQGSGSQTYIFSQGYDVSCTTVENNQTNAARFVARGLNVHY